MPSKFGPEKYIDWMNNLISIVNNFYLVIYTDVASSKYINTRNNPNIKVIIKPIESFHNYQYKNYWIKNHQNNFLLNGNTCWQLNMLWSEKIHFVKDTADNKYFDTDFYGWCDIGYFRNRPQDVHTSRLTNWGKNQVILNNQMDKICYACIQNNDDYMNELLKSVRNRNAKDLPVEPISPHQYSIAGGFFFCHKKHIDWWATTYDSKLILYFENNYLVKDDQIILADCILTNLSRFTLFRENIPHIDNWFMFQRFLK
jgi:hypothetical protein